MKIAFIVSGFPLLSETFILNQIIGLLDLGHQVKIFSSFNPKEKKNHSDFDKYQLKEKICYFSRNTNTILRIFEAISLLFKYIFKYPVLILKSRNVFKYGKEALLLRSFFVLFPFLKEKFDIIHCHFGPNGLLGVYLKKIGIPGKYVTTFHGYDINAYVKIKGRYIYRDLFKQMDLFTVNSEFIKKKIISLGCEEKKIIILPVGIRMERFKFHERAILPRERINILIVGRLVEVKGHEYAIFALSNLINRKYNIKCIIAGTGPLEQKLKDIVANLNIGRYFNFVGPVTQDEVIELYEKAHIFLLPCVTDSNGNQETQGLVFQEAQSVGLPVIATYCGGIPEGVHDGKAGLLVPEKNVEALTQKIGYLIEHPEIWPKMGRYGRNFVKNYYDVSKLNQKLVKYYTKI